MDIRKGEDTREKEHSTVGQAERLTQAAVLTQTTKPRQSCKKET